MESTQLGALRSKLLREAQELEDKLKERREKIKAIDMVRGLLIEESSNQPGNKPIDVDGNRFRTMGLTEAILNCMSDPIRLWTIPEMKNKLKAGGLKTKSKDLYSSISATLQRLESKGKIEVQRTEKGRRGFKIKEQDSIEELLKEKK